MKLLTLLGLLGLIITGLNSTKATASHEYQTFELPGEHGNETVEIFVMDALPAGEYFNTTPRLVWLNLTLELHGDWYGNTAGLETPFEIVANDETLLFTTFSTFHDLPQSSPGVYPGDNFYTGGRRVYDIRRSFPLYFEGDWPTDIQVQLTRLGTDTSGTWSLTNASLNWRHHIPEPSYTPALMTGLLLVAISGYWARRRHLARTNLS